MTRSRRGMTLLLVIGMVTVMMMAASTVMMRAGERYHIAQFTRDRLQALQCAQAGLLWARARLGVGEEWDGAEQIDLGDVGFAEVSITAAEGGVHVVSLGTALRDGADQASRRLEVVWP